MKLLFIGNSATYVHDVPQTLKNFASELGYDIEVNKITPGGCELAMHADISTEHGQRVFAEIAKGYDIVFLQDNGNCISSEEKREASLEACRRLGDAVKESGARLYYYVRPPYGKINSGFAPFEQCEKFDRHFNESAGQTGAACVYVNRAFAYAIKNFNCNLWGEDNAHTSILGAYLIVCTFFATLFGESATRLPKGELDESDAKVLAEIADKIVFDKVIPWEIVR